MVAEIGGELGAAAADGGPLESFARAPVLIFTFCVMTAIMYIHVHHTRSWKRRILRFILLALALFKAAVILAIYVYGRDFIESEQVTRYYPELAKVHYERQFDTACDTRLESVNAWMAGTGTFRTVLEDNIEGYVMSHLFGWALGTIAVTRDPWFSFLLSLSHEVIESMFEAIYPPFRECWWDKLILDIGANFIGCVLLAPLVMKFLGIEIRNYFKYPAYFVLIGGCIQQFALFPILFWFPHVFGVPPKHSLSVCHLFLYHVVWNMLCCHQAYDRALGHEKYDWLRWDWVLHLLMALEMMCIYKYNAVCNKPLEFEGWRFYFPIAMVGLSFCVTHYWVENLRHWGAGPVHDVLPDLCCDTKEKKKIS